MPANKRRTSNDRKFDIDKIPLVPRILIVCEGERTEPNYFRQFCVTNSIFGEAMNTLSLVRRTIEIRDEKGPFNQVWCVFDLDSFPKQHFDEAIQLAKKENIKTAYSNEAFELWYILHYDYLQSQISRSQYIKTLGERLCKKYHKNDLAIYDDLLHLQETAILNAKRLLEEHHPIHTNCSEKKPSTTVYELVLELNKHMRPTQTQGGK